MNPRFRTNSTDREFMQAAIAEQDKCTETPRVGAVIVKNGEIVAAGHRHEGKIADEPGMHAEAVALEKLDAAGIRGEGSTMYVTMEPCNQMAKNCAQRIIDADVREVVIGCYDLNPDVNRLGWEQLKNAGIRLRDFDSDLIEQSRSLNPVEHFHKKIGPIGHGKFAYKQNGNKGEFDLRFSESDQRTITFGCSSRSETSVYVYGRGGAACAEARKAEEFKDIDNPDAYQYDYAAEAEIGDITLIRSKDGCALVEVTAVNKAEATIKFKFEIREL